MCELVSLAREVWALIHFHWLQCTFTVRFQSDRVITSAAGSMEVVFVVFSERGQASSKLPSGENHDE